MCPPNPICLDECVGGLHGRSLGGVLCCSQLSSWILHPGSIKTGPEMPCNGATRSAYPSSCSGKGHCIVNNPSSSGVVCLDRAFGLGPSHVNKGLAVGNHLVEKTSIH
jgi:hypothetical protein